MIREQHLKIRSEFFDAVRYGVKTFEIRKNDRDYRVGDVLVLKEIKDNFFTGNLIKAIVTYITDYEQKEGYVVMAIELDD